MKCQYVGRRGKMTYNPEKPVSPSNIPPMTKESLKYAIEHNTEEKPVAPIKKTYPRWKSVSHRFPRIK